MQKIVPHLWYDTQAEKAADLYISIFSGKPSSRSAGNAVTHIERYPKAAESVSGKKAGSVMTVAFELDGQQFLALNGGPQFQFNESISFLVNCEDQAEVDYFWGKLTEDGGQESMCGWLKDKFGMSWQIVPKQFNEFMKGDKEKMEKVMAKLLTMKKVDLEALQEAAEKA